MSVFDLLNEGNLLTKEVRRELFLESEEKRKDSMVGKDFFKHKSNLKKLSLIEEEIEFPNVEFAEN